MKLNGFITVVSALIHGADEKLGTTVEFRREPMIYNGETEMIPVLSGNAIRGKLRRVAANDFLEKIGMEKGSIPQKLYYMFFSGGSLEKGSKQDYIEIGSKRELRKMIPFLSLFGCSFKNQVMEGKMRVGKGIPVAKETVEYTGENSNLSVWELVSKTFYTRRDDLEDKVVDEKKKEDETAQQMKFEIETLIAGTRLSHSFELMDCSEVEEACFYAMLHKFNESPHFGGMASKGHGLVNIGYILKSPDKYHEYLEANKDKIKAYIERIS